MLQVIVKHKTIMPESIEFQTFNQFLYICTMITNTILFLLQTVSLHKMISLADLNNLTALPR